MRRQTFSVLLSTAVIALGGCGAVAVDPRTAFSRVSELVKERGGHEVSWNGGEPMKGPAATIVRRSLTDGLTIERAVEIALLNNRDLQAIYADLGVAQSDLVQASLLHNPVLGSSAAFPIAGGAVDVSLGLAIDVIDLFYVPLRKRVAAGQLEEVKSRIAGEVLDVVWKTETAFHRHQADVQMLEVRRQIGESTAASFEVARRLREAGNVTELELSSEQALAEEARLDLRLAEVEVRESREVLNTLMGLWGEDTGWEISSRRLADPPDDEMTLDRLEARAVERSLDLEAAEARGVALAEQLGLERTSGLFPEVVVVGGGERDQGEWESGPSLQIPVPLFDRGQARTARAAAELGRARNFYYALAVRVRSTTRSARDRLLGHRDRALYYRNVQLPLHERIVREAGLHYNAMQLGPFELLRAKEQQIETGVRYVEALRDYWLAATDLRLILAGRLPPGEPQPPPAPIEGIRRFPFPTVP